MISFENRMAVNPVMTDKRNLINDLRDLKNILFDSIGVIGIKVIGNPYKLVRTLKRESMKHSFYHIQDDVYVILCKDVPKQEFDHFFHKVKTDLKSRYDGAVSVYDLYSQEDPQPEQMILMIMKLIQVNQDALEISEEHKVILKELEDGCYIMYLQPKADSRTGIINGAEALVRYKSRNGSIFPPGRFIPQLEQKGLIYHIDIFIFEETCRILRRWQDTGHEPYPISLNFSRITLMHEDLIKTMNRIQKRYRVSKEYIEIEITESVEMMDKEKLKEIGSQIAENGYRLSLDDFGVSFSNISILSILKFNTLKVDRSIVEDICQNERLQIIIKGLIEVCHMLGIEVIAEGIETKRQMKTLFYLGCDSIQGYLIGRPIAEDAYEKIYFS